MKFTPRSESTRSFIIEAAADLFNRQGYAGTSIKDLENITKLTKGSIYGNFENKEQLALAVFDYNLDCLRQRIKTAISSHSSCKERILAYLSIYYDIVGNKGGCPLQNTAIEADDTHEGLRERAASGLLNWKDSLVILLNAGIGKAEFKADTDVEKTALTFIALIEGGILISRATRNRDYLQTLLEAAKDTIERIVV